MRSPGGNQWVPRILTANVTSWVSGRELLAAAAAQEIGIVALQEHRLGKQDIAEASAWAHSAGWDSVWAEAVSTTGCPDGTDGRRWSGGVAVFARHPLQLVPEPPDQPLPRHDGRLIGSLVDFPGKLGRLLVASVYLRPGVGLDEGNLQVLGQFGAMAAATGCPFVLGGDFNCGPTAVGASGFPGRLQGVIAAATEPTCLTARSQSVLDYFVMSESIVPALDEVFLPSGFHISPHRAVLLQLRPVGDGRLVPVLRRPQRLPTEPVFGPARQPPRWDGIKAAVRSARMLAEQSAPEAMVQGAIDAAYGSLAEHVARCVAACTDVAVRRPADFHRGPDVRWVPFLDLRTPARTWKSFARPARWLEQRCIEAIALVRGAASGSEVQEHCMASLGRLQARIDEPVDDLGSSPELLELLDELARLVRSLGPVAAGHAMEEELEDLQATMAGFQARAQQLAEKEAVRAGKSGKEQWASWAAEACAGGAGRAHRWTKVPVAWRPPTVRMGERYSADQLKVLQAEAARLGELWEVQDAPQVPCFRGESDDRTPPITSEELLKAVLTFPAKTASTFDGLHVKHWGMIGAEGAEVVAQFLDLLEKVQRWPGTIAAAVTTLIPKVKAGAATAFRGIALLPSLYRVWCRARRSRFRQWEKEHRSGMLAAQAGGGCIRAVWGQAATCEMATMGGQAAGAVLWDLSNFYEHICRRRLHDRAAALGYPMRCLGLASAMYGARRLVMLGQMVCEVGCAARGIPAGCGLATFHVQAYVLAAVAGFAARWPMLQITVYIDDIALQGTARREDDLLQRLAAAAKDLHECIELDLDCQVAPHKAAVVASTTALRSNLRRKLGSYGGPPLKVGPNLGIDFSAGRTRAFAGRGATLFKRVKGAVARSTRLARLRRARRDRGVGHLFRTGVQSGATFGCEVWGLADGQVRDLQNVWLGTLPPQSQGRSRSAAMLLFDDPTVQVAIAPILHLCSECWRSALDPMGSGIGLGSIAKLWTLVAADPPLRWSQVRGPMGAVFLSLRRCGWSVGARALVVIDDWGEARPLTTTSPAHLKKLLLSSARRKLEEKAGVISGITGCTRLSAEGAKQGMKHRDLTPQQRLAGMCWFTGALWTRERLHSKGYDIEVRCDLCGGPSDSMHHRLWECPAAKEIRRQTLSEEQAARLSTDAFAHCRKGVCPHPHSYAPEPAHDGGTQYWHRDGIGMEQAFSGAVVFTDGSASVPDCRGLARAGWAAVIVDGCGAPVASLRGPVWSSLPQTSGAAELAAFAAVCQVASGPVVVCSDYQRLVSAHDSGARYDGKHMLAGTLRSAYCSPGARFVLGIIKVKAHQNTEDLEKLARVLALGNEYADAQAKLAVEGHPAIPEGTLMQAGTDESLCKWVFVLASRVLALWPSLTQVGRAAGKSKGRHALARGRSNQAIDNRTLDSAPSTGSIGPAAPLKHDWLLRNKGFRCMRCFQVACGARRFVYDAAGCPGRFQALVELAEDPKGHSLLVFAHGAQGAQWLLACLRCCRYGATKLASVFGEACPGHSSTGRDYRMRRMQRGIHPKQLGVELEEGVPLL